MKRIILLLLVGVSLSVRAATEGWYGGVGLGAAFGHSTLSSFAESGIQPGGAIGGFVGWRPKRWLGLEVDLKAMALNMRAQECCTEAGYWLGSDLNRYFGPVAGLEGWDYAELRSVPLVGSADLRVMLNLLGFGRERPWELQVYPKLAGLYSQPLLRNASDRAKATTPDGSWLWGWGGGLNAGRQIGQRLTLSLYAEATVLERSGLDGVPRHQYRDDYIFEGGLRLAVSIGRKEKQAQEPIPYTPTAERTQPDGQEKPKAEAKSEEPIKQTSQPAQKLKMPEIIDSLTVFYAFNSAFPANADVPLLREFAERVAQDYAQSSIIIEAWTDTVGGAEVNQRVSLRRAEEVKALMIQAGVSEESIRLAPRGMDANAATADEARRARITVWLTKQ